MYYSEFDRHLVALDCVIFGFDGEGLNLLYIKRDFEPAKGRFSLMGGFLMKDESLDEAANRILKELVGLEDIYLEQLYTFGDIQRDPGNRTISVAYYALIKFDKCDQDVVNDCNAFWSPVKKLPDLIFDHRDMVEMAHARLKRKAATGPIGFKLLPEKFTMPQIQKLYEAIYQVGFDKRNFSKKLLAMNVLEKLNEKVKNNSKKGAFLFRFDQEKYHKLLETGANFELKH